MVHPGIVAAFVPDAEVRNEQILPRLQEAYRSMYRDLSEAHLPEDEKDGDRKR
jgi:hypothetical protein